MLSNVDDAGKCFSCSSNTSDVSSMSNGSNTQQMTATTTKVVNLQNSLTIPSSVQECSTTVSAVQQQQHGNERCGTTKREWNGGQDVDEDGDDEDLDLYDDGGANILAGPLSDPRSLRHCTEIRPNLFLGAEHHARDMGPWSPEEEGGEEQDGRRPLLHKLGITHILTCISGPVEQNRRDNIVTLRCPMSDYGLSDLDGVCAEAMPWIGEAIGLTKGDVWDPEGEEENQITTTDTKVTESRAISGATEHTATASTTTEGRSNSSSNDDNHNSKSSTAANKNMNKLLIHCKVGINRSATMVIAWLMCSEQIPLKKAYQAVSEKRNICLHDNYIAQLRMLDERWFGRHSTAEGELPSSNSVLQQALSSFRDTHLMVGTQ